MAEIGATGADAGPHAPSTAAAGAASAERPSKIRKFDRPEQPRDWRFFVGGIGKVLIAVGLLMFGFVAYQLWGTGIETARAQNSLENEFAELLAGTAPATPPPTTSPTTSPSTSPNTGAVVPPVSSLPAAVPAAEQNLPSIDEGDALARLEIPRIDVDWIVVAGVETADLKKGPGHYPETPLPGQLGNAAIAGHRTTYGQPFYSIEQLQPGDEIITTTPTGRYVYIVTGQQIVSPEDYQVITTTDPTSATLTLTSCHPRWTTRERIVITSQLDPSQSDPVGEALINYGRPIEPLEEPEPGVIAPVDTSTADTSSAADTSSPETSNPATGTPATSPDETVAATTIDPSTTESNATDPATGDSTAPGSNGSLDAGIADAFAEGWFSDPTANAQVALWGILVALIGLGSYLISRRVKRDWVGALVGVVPFVVALYFFFQNVNRLLPPNL